MGAVGSFIRLEPRATSFDLTRAICFMMSYPDDSAIGPHQKGPAETAAAV